MSIRIGVTGGRSFDDLAAVERALAQVPVDAVLVHGQAPGADTLCANWWKDQGRADDPHPAQWSAPCRATCKPGHRRQRADGSTYCPAAGVYRNQEMVDSGLDELIVFPGGTGTADMVQRATHAGIKPIYAEGSADG